MGSVFALYFRAECAQSRAAISCGREAVLLLEGFVLLDAIRARAKDLHTRICGRGCAVAKVQSKAELCAAAVFTEALHMDDTEIVTHGKRSEKSPLPACR